MCKVFPCSLGPIAMRWFDGLKEGFIRSFEELTRAFRARVVMCSRVPRPLDSMLSMVMREIKTLKTYSDRYWETFNKIDGDFEDVAIRIFKVGLPIEHNLRKSLTMKLARSICQLIDHIDKHMRSRRIRPKGKARPKPYQKRRIIRQLVKIRIDPRWILLTSHRGLVRKLSARCLRSQYIKSLRR